MDIVQNFIETQSFKKYQKIKKLTEPLRDCFGVTTFWHYRVDAQGSFFYTGNDPVSMSSYVELNLHHVCPYFAHPDFFPQVNVVCDTVNDAEYQKEFKKMYDKTSLQNIYLVLRKTAPQVCEGFGFASTSSDNCILEVASQSPEIFDSFLEYYLEETKGISNDLYSNRVSIRELRGSAFATKTDLHKRLQLLQGKRLHFMSTIEAKDTYSIDGLTAREKECVFYYLKGFSAEETAKALFISRRTVEAHFEHVKQKLNLSSKRQLLQKIDLLDLIQ